VASDQATAVSCEAGGYVFVLGSDFASQGVAALPGMTIQRAELAAPADLEEGFSQVRRHLERLGRPLAALCGLELRMPEVLSGQDFLDFNRTRYLAKLQSWGLLRQDGSPLARTNVAPRFRGPPTISVSAFSFTAESAAPGPAFVLSGLAELPEDRRYPRAIIRRGESDAAALMEKTAWIVGALQARMRALGLVWDDAAAVRLYSTHAIAFALQREVLAGAGIAPANGVTWLDAAPPVPELALEIDVRCCSQEYRLAAA